jgi:nitrile hydratase beta subunit
MRESASYGVKRGKWSGAAADLAYGFLVKLPLRLVDDAHHIGGYIIQGSVDGVHDMGGMHGFGPVRPDPNEPVFHARWEAQVRTMMRHTIGRYYHIDEFRRTIERMPADQYLRASYYEKWLHAVQTMLLEKGVITEQEVATGRASGPAAPPQSRKPEPPPLHARFQPGDRVVTRIIHPKGHTRLPRYARGKPGVIRTVNGPFLLPDANAQGEPPDWQACYAVEFRATDLWGTDAPATDRVCVDLWESYLDPEESK